MNLVLTNLLITKSKFKKSIKILKVKLIINLN
jgi:hypothetical protein